jgi:amino acid adenylation domain-containing protein
MLEDAGAGVVLTEEELEKRLPAYWGQTVSMDVEWEKISQESESEPGSEVVAANPAYVIYTSGSTGRPKGVVATHSGLCNLVEAQKEALGVGNQSRVLQFASLSFDASVWEIFSALAAGGSLWVYPQGRLMPGEDLERTLREDEITMATLPPTALAVMRQDDLGQLQTVIAAGEACGAEIVERWGRGRRFIDAYGPTETTVCASLGECETGNKRRPSIGRPIANTEIYILDREMNPVPVGVRGELCVAGAGLTRGYMGRPELTAERFVPNIFNQEGGARLYRTGDVSRYLWDGKIEYVGRSDEQVKVRGYRVELGEIEAVLNEHRTVRQSVVVAREGEREGKRLIGYVVGDEEATPGELKRHLRERLPEYMVPEMIVMLKEAPLTASGKIDRKRLPAINDRRRHGGPEYVAPRTPVEEIVVRIIEEVLMLDRVGRNDDFFEIGGHSLSATQVVSRMKNTFGVEIGVRSVFEGPTAAGLARRIEEAIRTGESDEAPPLVRAERASQGGGQKGDRMPLSFAQQRLWFIDQLQPNNPIYNIPGAVRLEGRFDLEVLERVINEIVRRHEVLRTRIEVEKDEPVQVIDEWKHWRLEAEDLTSLTKEQREEEVQRLVREEADTGFDLSRGPLLRVKAIKLDEDEHVVLFTMHHIVSDGWSMEILFKEVGALYRAYSKGEPSPLEELPIQYADFAVWQRKWLQGKALENHLAYWRRQLGGGLTALELPIDRPRPAMQTHRGAHRTILLPITLLDSLKALSLKQSCTLFMTLLSAFKALIYYLTRQTDIIVGTDVANRNRAETEKLIGFFVNQLVLRTELSPNHTFEELLRKVREVTLGGYAHQDLPFEKLVEVINPDRDESRTPLFQVKLTLQNVPAGELSLPSLTLNPITTITDTAKFDLLLDLNETELGLYTSLQYNTDLFEETTIIRMLNLFHVLLGRIVERPEAKLHELIASLIEEDKSEQFKKDRDLEGVLLRKFRSATRRAVGETYVEIEQ